MQTFLTNISSFSDTARTLDNKRLNKQALEAWQIMMVNLRLNPDGSARESKAWRNHPATLMWTGCEDVLLGYIGCMVMEWRMRGFQSVIFANAVRTKEQARALGIATDGKPRWWLDEDEYEQIIATHRQALLVKDYEHYSQFGWSEEKPTEYNYLWVPSGIERVS